MAHAGATLPGGQRVANVCALRGTVAEAGRTAVVPVAARRLSTVAMAGRPPPTAAGLPRAIGSHAHGKPQPKTSGCSRTNSAMPEAGLPRISLMSSVARS